MSDSHDQIIWDKRRLILRLVRTLDEGCREDVDVILVLAHIESGIGRWIRGDHGYDGAPPIASFVSLGRDAHRLRGGAPSRPGLVVLVVDPANVGCLFRFTFGGAS